jgi:hypothetical protein
MDVAGALALVDFFTELGLPLTTIKPVRGRAIKLTAQRLEQVIREGVASPHFSFTLVRDQDIKYSVALSLHTDEVKGMRTAVQAYLPWTPFAENGDLARQIASGIGPVLAPLEILIGHIHSFADIVRTAWR